MTTTNYKMESGNQLKLIGQFLNHTHASQTQGIQGKEYRKLIVYNPKIGQEMAKKEEEVEE